MSHRSYLFLFKEGNGLCYTIHLVFYCLAQIMAKTTEWSFYPVLEQMFYRMDGWFNTKWTNIYSNIPIIYSIYIYSISLVFIFIAVFP